MVIVSLALLPPLSVATAENVYAPAGRLLTDAEYGGLMLFPSTLVPCRNWTFVTEPSESEALAVRVKDAGAANTEPLPGVVKATVGGTFAA